MDLAQQIADLATKIAVLQNTIKMREEALVHQAIEYERRLAELNHSHMLNREAQQQFVTREIYDQKHTELQHELAAIQIWRARIMGMSAGIGVSAGICGGIVASIIAKILK